MCSVVVQTCHQLNARWDEGSRLQGQRKKQRGFSGCGGKAMGEVKMVGRVAFACGVGPIAHAMHGNGRCKPHRPGPRVRG